MSDYTLGPEFPGDRGLLRYCLGLVNPEDGWALEFGTGSGETAALIAKYVPVITFDSFAGLPEDWRPEFPKGAFAEFTMPEIVGATVVPGWFDESLPGYDWPEQVSLVHMDADLYSSTLTALDHIAGLMRPGLFIVFDEWFGYDGCEEHEQKAWAEFSFGWLKWEVVGHGREQWAIRITEVKS